MKKNPNAIKFRAQFLSFARTHFFYLLFLGVLLLLNARNPFSTRTLIPNLEPFPDTFYYINSSLNFLHGNGMRIGREGRFFTPIVPPLYSLALAPVFAINNDVRLFYLTNLILAVISFTLFYKIIRFLFPTEKVVQAFLLLLYSTHFIFYWYTQWAMAENLLIPIFLLAFWIVIKPLKNIDVWLLPAVAVALYVTKYAALPYMLAFMALFALKVWRDSRRHQRYDLLSKYVASLAVFGGGYILYEFLFKESNILAALIETIRNVTRSLTLKARVSNEQYAQQQGGYFSLKYVPQNSPQYVGWLLGSPLKVLWQQVVALPRFLAIPAMIGVVGTLVFKPYRRVGLVLVGVVGAGIGFLSLFYAVDGRYFLPVVPLLLIGFGYFLLVIKKITAYLNRSYVYYTLAFVLCIAYCVTSFSQLKFQMALNLKYAETPWYYISVTTFDTYLQSTATGRTQTPVVISALPPYYIDFYRTQPLIILPLSDYQEFRTRPQEAWGDIDIMNLHQVYANYLKAGHPVYVAKYGLGNEIYLQDAFEALKKDFTLTEVSPGCFTQCPVYQIQLLPTSKL